MIHRAAVITEARSWIGTPWHHHQSTKGVGCDCIGFVRGVARGIGLADPFDTPAGMKYRGYAKTPEPAALLAACAEFLIPVPRAAALPGDVLVFRIGNDPMHFAILSDRVVDGKVLPHMIHAYALATREAPAGKVVENRIDAAHWEPKIVGAHRIAGVA